ncbi:MAG: hypothetical protein ACKVPX_10630 [Myxococcaceae bacterium]
MRHALALFVLFGLSACGPVFFIEAEIPRVCKAFQGETFPGVPVPTPDVPYTAPPLDFDFGTTLDELRLEGLETEIRISSMRLTAAGGLPNLDFLNTVNVNLLPPGGSSLAPLPVVDYARAAGASSSTSIELGEVDIMDVYEYIRSGQFSVQITFLGTIPTSDWSLDVRPCLYARGKFQYL